VVCWFTLFWYLSVHRSHPPGTSARMHASTAKCTGTERPGSTAHWKAFFGGRGAHNTLLFVFCEDSISCLPQYSGIHLHLRMFVFVILSPYSHYIPKGVRNISGTSYIISGIPHTPMHLASAYTYMCPHTTIQ
jgi:hypothetical protein